MEEESSQGEREHHPLSYSTGKSGQVAAQHKDNHSTPFPISHTVLILPLVFSTN